MSTQSYAMPLSAPPQQLDTAHMDAMKAWVAKFPPWIYPPPEFEPVDVIGYAAINDIAMSLAGVTVVSFQVPPNRNGVINTYGNNYVGGGFNEGSGNLYWQYRRNKVPIKFYQKILASLGTPTAPTRHPCGFRVFENDIVDIFVTNVAIAPFANQLSGGRLAGWLYPKRYDDKRIWV